MQPGAGQVLELGELSLWNQGGREADWTLSRTGDTESTADTCAQPPREGRHTESHSLI